MKKFLLTITIVSFFFLGAKNIKFDQFAVELIGQQKLNLEKVVSKALEGSSGDYAVAIKNLKTGEGYYHEESRIFDAGSFYKLGVILTALKQIEKGELTEDENLSGNVGEINKVLGVTNEEAELKEGTIELTVKNALRQMIAISHNYAAVLLTEKVGVRKAQDTVNSLGLKKTLIDTPERPKTTAADLVLFFEKIYKREGMSAYVSHEMLELLFNQEINDRIPKYLPKEARVAHKTAELDYQKHDAGIVFLPKGDYIIVVLSESNNPSAAAERIAILSKNVYEYLEEKN